MSYGKLTPTMIRSLSNLGETPVGDWLMALNARKINAHSTYALQRRGLIERVSISCDAAGCACAGRSVRDPEDAARPSTHLAITPAGREAIGLPAPAPGAEPLPKARLTAGERQTLENIAAGTVTGEYVQYGTWHGNAVPKIDGLNLQAFMWADPDRRKSYEDTSRVLPQIFAGLAAVEPGPVTTGTGLDGKPTRGMRANVVLTAAGRRALGLEPAAPVVPAAAPVEAAPVTAPAPAPAPGIHLAGHAAPATLKTGDTIAALAEDGESVAWIITTTPRRQGRAGGGRPATFAFVADAVCDDAGRPRNDRRVIELRARDLVELVTAVPDYRTGSAAAGVKDMRRVDIADVPDRAGRRALVYLTDVKDPSLNGLVWFVEGIQRTTIEGGPHVSLRLSALCDRSGIAVTPRTLDYGGAAGHCPVILCGVNER